MQSGGAARSRLFLLIDPTLRGAAGHNLDYARIVVAEAHAVGFACQVVAHASAALGEADLGCPVRRTFRRGHKDIAPGRPISRGLKRFVGGPAYHLARSAIRELFPATAEDVAAAEYADATDFRNETAELLADVRPVAGDRLFFPNLSWAEAVHLCELVEAGATPPGVELQAMLRFDPTQSERGQQRLAAIGGTRGVVWMSDTEELAAAYASILGAPVACARIPIDGGRLRAGAQRKPSPDPVRVAALGESRREKGFHLLPGIVQRVRAADPGVEFSVQLSHNIETGEPGMREAEATLRDMAGPGLSLLGAELPTAEFNSLVSSAHIMLLPYDARAYQLRSSGLLVQALAAGMRVVAPAEHSWIRSCLQRNALADHAVLSEHSVEGYAAAVLEAASAARAQPRLDLAPVQEETRRAPWAEAALLA
jgi:hypothetical protein